MTSKVSLAPGAGSVTQTAIDGGGALQSGSRPGVLQAWGVAALAGAIGALAVFL